MKRLTKELAKNKRGAAVMEFALLFPVLLILSLPLMDYFQYIMTIQKLNKTASRLADMIVISTPGDGVMADSDPYVLSRTSLTTMLQTTGFLMHPFPFPHTAGSEMTVTSIHRTGSGVEAPWSASYSGQDVTLSPSGEVNILPASFRTAMYPEENVIAVTINYTFDPVIKIPGLGFIPSLGREELQITQFFPTRNGPLRCVKDYNC